ncbi:MAG: class I SAM-dependent methyltransferase [Gammaproteobacteria bacterium]|nr:class I SAM-dependent methyltransferase [Gammaproteobacteria bacterium]
MGDSEAGQVSEAAAKIYEEVYLPALFQQWCPLVVQAANVVAGDSVIDVACGTGALAIAVSDHIAPNGTVVGVDINQAMLNIAKSKSSFVTWLNAPAEALPFNENSFNRAVSQFGLMYFENQETAIREMMRVLQPGAILVVVVWDELANNPGLFAEEHLWQQVFGEAVDETPYHLGDKGVLENLFKKSGVSDFQIKTHQGIARFDSIENWIHTGARGWTNDDALNDDELGILLDTAEKELTDFRTRQGAVAFPISTHIVTARK